MSDSEQRIRELEQKIHELEQKNSLLEQLLNATMGQAAQNAEQITELRQELQQLKDESRHG